MKKESCLTTLSDRQYEMNLLATEERLAINNIYEISNWKCNVCGPRASAPSFRPFLLIKGTTTSVVL